MNNPLEQYILIDEYVRGTISPENSDLLLNQIRQNPDLLKILRANVLADFLLDEKYAFDRKTCLPGNVRDLVESEDQEQEEDFDLLLSELVEYEKNAIPIPKTEIIDHRSIRRKKRNVWIQKSLLGIAVLLFIVIGSWASWLRVCEEWAPEQTISFDGIAKIVEMIDPVWEHADLHYKEGQSLGPDNLFLKSGQIRLLFSNGITMILDGPVDLTLSDPMHTFCKEGKISVLVPPEGIGFELLTPFAKVVDRGTEFALRIEKDAMDLKVLQGKIDLYQGPTLLDSLVDGKDFFISKSIALRSASPIDPEKWITSTSFHSMYEKSVRIRKEKDLRRTVELNSNPNLLARFDFNDVGSGSIPNRSARNAGLSSEAKLMGTRTDIGDLPDKKSVKIDSSSSNATFKISGQYNNLTLFARVKIHRLRNEANVFFVSEQFQKEDGGFIWQIA